MPTIDALYRLQPGFKMLDITAHTDALTLSLWSDLQRVEGRLILAQYPGEHAAVPEDARFKVQTIADYTKPFRALPRDNDIVFLRDVLHRHTQAKRLLKAVYTTLANAAEVVIVTQQDEADVDAQLALLEACDFRAGNVIDGLIPGARVVVGKKMHMWGNGL